MLNLENTSSNSQLQSAFAKGPGIYDYFPVNVIIWQGICKLYIQSSPEEMEIRQNFLNLYIYLYCLSLVHLTNKVVGDRHEWQTDESLRFALGHFSGAPEPAEPFQLLLCCSALRKTPSISSSPSERAILPY